MGGQGSKTEVPPGGPIVEIMTDKYGPKSVSCLPIWTRVYGFTEGGSLSKLKINMLRQGLEEAKNALI